MAERLKKKGSFQFSLRRGLPAFQLCPHILRACWVLCSRPAACFSGCLPSSCAPTSFGPVGSFGPLLATCLRTSLAPFWLLAFELCPGIFRACWVLTLRTRCHEKNFAFTSFEPVGSLGPLLETRFRTLPWHPSGLLGPLLSSCCLLFRLLAFELCLHILWACWVLWPPSGSMPPNIFGALLAACLRTNHER